MKFKENIVLKKGINTCLKQFWNAIVNALLRGFKL
jgi:hypothetical protein